jgi:hypothetical protein
MALYATGILHADDWLIDVLWLLTLHVAIVLLSIQCRLFLYNVSLNCRAVDRGAW